MNKPIPVELKAGEEYYFCTCGKSANQPFCNGSHKGTGFTPKAFVAEEDGDRRSFARQQKCRANFRSSGYSRGTIGGVTSDLFRSQHGRGFLSIR